MSREEKIQSRSTHLQEYFAKVFTLLASQPNLEQHVDELDSFFALRRQVQRIRANIARKTQVMRQEAEEAAAGVQRTLASAQPLDAEQLELARESAEQLQRLVGRDNGDVRHNKNVNVVLRSCLGRKDQLIASTGTGPFVDVQSIPIAEDALQLMQVRSVNEHTRVRVVCSGAMSTGRVELHRLARASLTMRVLCRLQSANTTRRQSLRSTQSRRRRHTAERTEGTEGTGTGTARTALHTKLRHAHPHHQKPNK